MAWSGDGQRALLDDNQYPSHVTVLNLRTGTAAQLSLGSGVRPLGFTTQATLRGRLFPEAYSRS